MKGTSRQPESSLELITHALGVGQDIRCAHLLAKYSPSFPEMGVSLVVYFRTCCRSVKAIQLSTFHSLIPYVDVDPSLC